MPDISCKSKHLNQIQVGKLRGVMNASGTRFLRYYIDFRHRPLNLFKELSATELSVLQTKIDALLADWDKKYDNHLIQMNMLQGKNIAAEMVLEAERKRSELRALLHATLNVNDAIDWESLKSKDKYEKAKFADKFPETPKEIPLPEEPKITLLDKIFGGAKSKRYTYQDALKAANQLRADAQSRFERVAKEYAARKAKWEEEQEQKKAEFIESQEHANALIDQMKRKWEDGDPDTIIEHASLVLERSKLPDCIPKNFDIAYDATSKVLDIHYQLPDPESLPLTKNVRFIANSGELTETKIAQKEAKDLFDSTCYQLCLRIIHEIFEADTLNHIDTVVFNGFTDTVDRATGKNTIAVIMSLMTNRQNFLDLDLSRVDPKVCFKNLKGVAASSLAGLAAITPVMQLDRADRRFIDAKNVALDDEGATNLASMHWEDFEHLVRQLFEKEFASRGGEVKVTQASSDGGVDAIAFDPDPITGGKIVIQAKRYTKTVGVSAVRDLYGTVLSEGASKGILITTADYGPDAHKFAAGKPLTLLSGSNLLFLLEKHGEKAKIDLKEARKELGLR